MIVTDPIADYLTRIRNAAQVRKKFVDVPYSKLKEDITKVLCNKGYIASYSVEQEGSFKKLRLNLKYLAMGFHAIKEMKRISKPGRRVYEGKGISKYLSGIGLYIVSTSRGIISDKEVRGLGIGGEVLFRIY